MKKPKSILNTMKSITGTLKGNMLFTNSLNLILGSGVAAAFGFLFWIIIARSFKAETVGLATTLLSTSSLLSLLGLAGFDTVFVRFLAKSKQKNELINSGLLIAGFVSAIIAAMFCFLIPVISPKLDLIITNFWYVVSFITLTTFMT